MHFLLFNAEGRKPSGVATFCNRLAAANGAFRVVSLEMEPGVEPCPQEVAVDAQSSHDPERIAQAAMEALREEEMAGVSWILAPNVGDACHEAATLLRSRLERAGALAAVLGICHSDDENQYRVLSHYQGELDGLLGVSATIVRRLGEGLPRVGEGEIGQLDYPLPRELPRRKGADGAAPLTLVYLGRLDREQKRIDRLPQALEELIRLGATFRLVVIGDGRDRSHLEAKLRNLKARYDWSEYEFAGVLPERLLMKRLAEADIALLFSEYEGTPIALLEALAVGLCPVVMDCASMREGLVREHSVIVPQGETAAMARAIREMDLNRGRIESIGARGRTAVLERHSAERCASQLEEAGRRALERRKAALRPPGVVASCHGRRLDLLATVAAGAPEGARVAVFGAGLFGRKLVDRLMGEGREVNGLYDSDPRKQGSTFRGLPVELPERMLCRPPDWVLIGSENFAEEMSRQLFALFEQSGRPVPRLVAASETSYQVPEEID